MIRYMAGEDDAITASKQQTVHRESAGLGGPRAGEAARLQAGLLVTETFRTSVPSFEAPDRARPDSTLAQGVHLGRYIVLKLLGTGGMGQVYEAYDPKLDRKVALKTLRGELTRRKTSQLIREAQALARMAHPNIVTVYDVGAVGEQVYLTIELVDGLTLKDWLAAKRRTWREILRVFCAAGAGLSAAHMAGVLHLDFKPSNVLVGEDGRVRVLDFGLARSAELRGVGKAPAGVSESTPASRVRVSEQILLDQTLTTAGTPAYMAPERFSGRADSRSDQFSFCVALYQALYGTHPLQGVDGFAGAAKWAVRPPPRLSKVPGWVHRAVLQGLEEDPKNRFDDLETLIRHLGQAPARLRRRWLGLAVAISLLLFGFLVWQHTRAERELLCQDAERRLADVYGRFNEPDAMHQRLLEALSLAHASHQDPLIVDILNYLVIRARIQGDVEEGRLWANLAGATIERLGRDGPPRSGAPVRYGHDRQQESQVFAGDRALRNVRCLVGQSADEW